MMKRTGLAVLAAIALGSFAAPRAAALGTPADQQIKNKAFVDYKDANGNDMAQVTSNEVTITVTQVAAVRVEPETGSKQSTAGSQVAYAVTVHNDGNGTDTFGLGTVVTGEAWTTTVYYDDNKDGIWDPGETTVANATTALPANGTEYLIVVVNIDAGASPEAQNQVVLTATSQFNNLVNDSGTYTTTALAASLEISKSVTPANPQPGDTVTYAIQGKNAGTQTAENIFIIDEIPANTTYVPGSMKFGPIGGTYATAADMTDAADGPGDRGFHNAAQNRLEVTYGDEAPFPPNGAGTGGIFYFQVTINAGTTAALPIGNSATATYNLPGQLTVYTSSSNEATVTVANAPAIDVTPAKTVDSGDPGDVITYPITVKNNGNAADTIDITYNSSEGWTWKIWYDVNGDGVLNAGDTELTDTGGTTGTIDTGSVAAGATIKLLAVATIPPGTTDGTKDTLVVTGTSSIDTGVFDTTGNLVTTVTAPNLAIAKVADKANAAPGATITYTITVTNNGTGVATNVIVSDQIPAFTTYKPESILIGATVATLASKTDADDADGASYDSGSNTVAAGGAAKSLGSLATFVVRFAVTVD